MKNFTKIAVMAISALTLLPSVGVLTATNAEAVIRRAEATAPEGWEELCYKDYGTDPFDLNNWGSAIKINNDLMTGLDLSNVQNGDKLYITGESFDSNTQLKVVAYDHWDETDADFFDYVSFPFEWTLNEASIKALQEGANFAIQGTEGKIYRVSIIRNTSGGGEVVIPDGTVAAFKYYESGRNVADWNSDLNLYKNDFDSFEPLRYGASLKVELTPHDNAQVKFAYTVDGTEYAWHENTSGSVEGVYEFELSDAAVEAINDNGCLVIKGQNFTVNRVTIYQGKREIGTTTEVYVRKVLFNEVIWPNEATTYPLDHSFFRDANTEHEFVLNTRVLLSNEEADAIAADTKITVTFGEETIEAGVIGYEDYENGSIEYVIDLKIPADKMAAVIADGMTLKASRNIRTILGVVGYQDVTEVVRNGEFIIGSWTTGHEDFAPRTDGTLYFWADQLRNHYWHGGQHFVADEFAEKVLDENGNVVQEWNEYDGCYYDVEKVTSNMMLHIPGKYFDGSMGYEVEGNVRVVFEFEPCYHMLGSGDDYNDKWDESYGSYTDRFKSQIQISHGSPEFNYNKLVEYKEFGNDERSYSFSLVHNDAAKRVAAYAEGDEVANDDDHDCLETLKSEGLIVKGQSIKINRMTLYGTYDETAPNVPTFIKNVKPLDLTAPVEYYNLQGMKVRNPAKGQLLIRVQGKKATKIIF